MSISDVEPVTQVDIDLTEPRAAADLSVVVDGTPMGADPVVIADTGVAESAALFRPPARPRAWLLTLVGDLVALASPALLRSNGRVAILGFAVCCVVFLHQAGMYRSRLHLSVLDDAPKLIGRDIMAAVIICSAIVTLNLKPGVPIFAGYVLLAITIHLVVRFFTYRVIGYLRAKGVTSYRTLIVGGGLVAGQIATSLRDRPQYGLRPIGYLDVDPLIQPESLGPVSHLGEITDLGRAIKELDVQVIIVAFANLPDSAMIDVLRNTDVTGRDVFIIPRLHEAYPQSVAYDHIGGTPVVRVRRSPRYGFSWQVKRALDMVVSFFSLVVLSPVLLAVALAVRLEGGPGIIFRQVRVGRDGKHFEVLKFRSMKPLNEAESSQRWNVAADDRIGRVGKFIRKTSLDELPQLYNILRGDMSLVGPRPERPFFVEQFSAQHPTYFHRHRVPCGLTGLAQISGLRGDTSIVDRARYDNFYIENWSLWLDIKILLMTVHEVIGARGA